MPRFTAVCLLLITAQSSVAHSAQPPSPADTAAAIDQMIASAEDDAIAVVDDATFLRRVSLDLIGRPASLGEITMFGLDPSPEKRSRLVARLLDSEEYAANWSRYWKESIFKRATNVRAGLVEPAFEQWMADNLRDNRGWDDVVTDLLTASGPVNNDGSTALIFAHEGQPEEIAAEASRLFLGVQIQCANCHDHPWDRWKREQFHELVAFFPRVSVRRDRQSDNMFDYEIVSVDRARNTNRQLSAFFLTRLDKNRDSFITENEAENTPLARVFNSQARSYIDKDGDGRISIEEIKTAEPPQNRPGQGATEHYMPDLSDPSSQGTLTHPALFTSDLSIRQEQTDQVRRASAARLFTARSNPWFAKAFVNRVWSELTSTAFYLPIDDMGPDRSAEHEAAIERLASDFTKAGYDIKWLMQVITRTQIYQRAINADAEGFVRREPTRLRADQLYDAVCQTLNVTALPLPFTGGRQAPGSRRGDQGRRQFSNTFGFDPSTPREDLTGTIPEALFLMNSPQLHAFIRAENASSTIRRISDQVLTDEDVVSELYLTALGREPKPTELKICMQAIADAPSRKEGLEDILWALLNSSEFQSKS
ncbi:MAG: DUF1549 domain-containing protein [Planctomycetaceae bacterium]|nr:DUF1549 domain-containing protein [Planctomycetaceae bacterium]